VDIGRVVEEWVARTGLDPGSRYVGRLLLTAVSLTPTKIRDLAVGSFIYAALFLTEGIGLVVAEALGPRVVHSNQHQFAGSGGSVRDLPAPEFGKNSGAHNQYCCGGISCLSNSGWTATSRLCRFGTDAIHSNLLFERSSDFCLNSATGEPS